jgi:uncharacterized protein (DUF1501 family)
MELLAEFVNKEEFTMLQFQSGKGVELCNGLTRRDFLRIGAVTAGSASLSLADLGYLRQTGAAPKSDDVNCILLFLVGGPSHLDTWDLKPAAPERIRGPFKPIKTNVPGIHLCEHFPLMAQMADQFALVRSVHHLEAPIHETGQQLMQTGRLARAGEEHPHYGAVVSHLRGSRPGGLAPFVVVPGPISNTGVSVSHGQTAGFLGQGHEPVFAGRCADLAAPLAIAAEPARIDPARLAEPSALVDAVDQADRTVAAAVRRETIAAIATDAYGQIFSSQAKQAFAIAAEPESLRFRYGMSTFGQSCLLARRLVEHGVRLVTVNMFDTVFNEITWDCHADGGSLATTLDDYKQPLCPMFDRAYTALLEDLRERGLLEHTLVVAMGEFGRTPQINPRGGRDHWPGCWSILFAGAGVRAGQVIGSSDKTGSEPKDRPVTPAEVAATIYRGLRIELTTQLLARDLRPLRLVEAEPIEELF